MFQNILDLGGNDLIWKGKPALPVANKENKQLDDSLKQKKIQVETLKAVLEKNIDNGKKMRQHFSDVCQTLNYKQQLYKSREHELEIEEHSQKLLERECSRLSQQIKETKQEIESFKKRERFREAAIAEQKDKREKLKSAIEWDEEALLQYLEESAQLEKDNMALLKYTTEDDSKIKELSLLVERLSSEAYDKKKALNDADTEVFIVQSELDRMQEEFKSAHLDRMDLITNWEKVMNQIHQRNNEMNNLSEYMIKMRDEEDELKKKLRDQKQLLATESARNKDLQLKIIERDNFATKLRNETNQEVNRETDLKAELETSRNISNYLLYQKQMTQNSINQLDKQLEQKSKKLQDVENDNSKLEKDIQTLSQETFDADHYIKELENLLQRETDRLFNMEKEFSALEHEIILCYQEMKEMKGKEKFMESQKKGCEVTMRNLNSKISTVDSSRIKQVITLQELESNLEKLRFRVKKMKGDTNEEEKLRIDTERTRLSNFIMDKNTVLNFLSEELKIMMEKVSGLTKALEQSKKTNEKLAEKIHFMEFYITNCQKSLQNSISRKEELLVQDCLSKFHLKRYQKILNSRNKSVLTLQKSKAEFETMMKERIEELKSCQDVIQIEIRAEKEECSKIKRKFHEYSDKASKLQARYRVLMDALGVEDSFESSQAELLMKAEDEKRSLQFQRDKLLSVVIKHEEELNALQNTLWLIQSTNEQFRKALYPPGSNAEDCEHLKNLEMEGQSLAIQIHTYRREITALEDSIQEKQNKFTELQLESTKLQNTLQKTEAENEIASKEISDLDNKLLRAEKSNSRLCANIFDTDSQSDIEQDIKIHLLRELRRIVSDLVFTAVQPEHNISVEIWNLYKEANLPLPARVRNIRSISSLSSGSRTSSRQSSQQIRQSTASSMSSEKSTSNVMTPSIVSVGSLESEN